MPTIAEQIEESGAIKYGKFKLSNGSLTDYYIDKYAFEMQPDVLDSIVEEITTTLNTDVDAIAGPALGAVPLVTGVSLRSGIEAALVRPGETHHGTQARIEGTIEKGDRVAIIEDVTTTGGTILDTADLVEDVGGVVEQLIVVVDRDEGAVANVREAGFDLEYLVQVGDDLNVDPA